MNQLEQIEKVFANIGGEFILPPENIASKLKDIKAFVFDWDGVFNNGTKDQNGTSIFSEVDSMGTNLLRFSNFLTHSQMPYTAVISGEHNSAAFSFTKRECFNACYYKMANKIDALNHFCKQFNLAPEEIAFLFDDVLDLSIAGKAGIRIFVKRKANPLFNQYVVKDKFADYITSAESGNFAVREACELMMGLKGVYDRVITERLEYSGSYNDYMIRRREINTRYFTHFEGNITEQKP
jgi:3-deoxy-D-manno-octulosonate 8-phosphate phosphatase (KDO 8-P phosphatase)